ncbi:MAG: DUF1800 domain-containing protein [Ideonella sp.]|nr:DUF1800 domain-containing protein [Ideonella sp.]
MRLAHQATFGPTEVLVEQVRTAGPAAWIAAQIATAGSRYVSGNGDAIHRNTVATEFCEQAAYRGPNCWRDWFSSQPLLWDFYRNALTQPDQLRQRVAFALQQILVVSNVEVNGTYGLREYHNMLLDNAFGNYRQVLRKVTLSPVMGDFLNNANNDRAAPNENFARELLQLFSIGTCELNADGSLKGGTCQATYGNDTVRAYAYALTGWTYPAGGTSPWGCWPRGLNCTYYRGDMIPVASFHDNQARTLLSGVTVPASRTPTQALELVLDSVMNHPNTPVFIGRQLIQHLVTSNPSGAYVQRVAQAFASGRYTAAAGLGGLAFGTGQRGDLAATVAAVLLDAEARTATPVRHAGQLRPPVLMFTGVLRALNGSTDGETLGWWWGETMRQHVFRPPSVFNDYPPDYPVAGTTLVGPAFGIHNANTALERLNFLTYLLYWGGTAPAASVPNAVGTRVSLAAFTADAADPARLVDRLSMLAFGGTLTGTARTRVLEAVSAWNAQTDRDNWQVNRVRTAAWLVFSSPQYQVIR